MATGPKQAVYKERPLSEALADPKDIEAAENRPTEDQIKDYHKDNPPSKSDVKGDQTVAVAEQPETPAPDAQQG